MSRQSTLIFALGLPLVACATTETPEPTATTTQAQITNVIPTPDTCNQGVKPSDCIQAPPLTVKTEPLRWKVDGVFSPGEYSGATQLPYTLDMSPNLGGTGTVYLNRVTNTQATAPNKDVLFVYLKDLTVPVDLKKVPQGKFDVFLDYARFEGADAFIAAEDRRIQLDLNADKLLGELSGAGSGSSASWAAMPNPEAGLAFRSGGCVVSANGNFATCSGELQIPLPASVLTKPAGASFEDPGIGLYVAHAEVNGTMPVVTGALAAARTQRTLWETVVFGRPRAFPLKVMSWNVNHGDDPDFAQITDDALGTFLAQNDIVALQEVWDRKDAQKIADAANAVRTSLGWKPFHVYGPVDMKPGWQHIIIDVWNAVEDTQGGLFVLTPMETAQEGNLVFDSDLCRGDDCFRAHGVQYLRLILDKPDFKDLKCRDGGAQDCPKPPSGDDYVDFFNVTLQSEDPPICDDLDTWHTIEPGLKAAIEQLPAPWNTILSLFIQAADFLVEDDLHCTSLTSAGVRDTQLGSVNKFIDSITSQGNDRPSLVVGDFKIDGRDISNATYQAMLAKLHISEPGSPSDIISEVNTEEWDWDVDHGDLAQERKTAPTGECLGTVIGTKGGTSNLNCPFDGNFDGVERTSYIFVRPRALPSVAASLPPATWIASKGQSGTQVWAAPFPSNTITTGGPPDRLSDKKPVVAEIELVPWVTPASYHGAWKHDATLRIASVNGTMFDDCPTCGEIDPKAKLHKTTLPVNQAASKQTTECTGIPTPIWSVDGCMGDWFFTASQAAGVVDVFSMQADVWEDDDTSGDDPLNIFTRSSVTFNAATNQGEFKLLAHDPNTGGEASLPMPFGDTMPLGLCSNALVDDPQVPTEKDLAIVCHRMEIVEIPPGQ